MSASRFCRWCRKSRAKADVVFLQTGEGEEVAMRCRECAPELFALPKYPPGRTYLGRALRKAGVDLYLYEDRDTTVTFMLGPGNVGDAIKGEYIDSVMVEKLTEVLDAARDVAVALGDTAWPTNAEGGRLTDAVNKADEWLADLGKANL